MKKSLVVQTIVFSLLSHHLAGCASGDGGQVLSGVLMGIGHGLSGL